MKASKFLDKKGVSFELVSHEPAKKCSETAERRGVDTSQIVKSLIIESQGEQFHVCVPGDRELSEKKFGGEYRLLPPEKSKELTGFESGTVHPFSTELKHVVDERVLENDKVSHTTGEDTEGVILGTEGFRKALEKSSFETEVRDVVVSTEEDFEEIRDEGLDDESANFLVENGYRSSFLDLSPEFSPERVLNLLKEFDRKELEVESGKAEEVLERAENNTHLQKLVEHFDEDGSLPEDSGGFSTEEVVEEVLEENSDAVEDLKNGKESAINFLLGQVMQETNGRADGGEVRDMIKRKI